MDFATARSALAWWLEAGVDVPVQEAARDWLAPPSAKTAKRATPATEALSAPLVMPETLDLFRDWLGTSADVPLAATGGKRVLPHGAEDAPIMLLSDVPAMEDASAGQPLGGDTWLLAQRMLAAIGIDAADAYVASLSCMHAPGSRMTEADRTACADIARKHIRIARPKRLLLLGDAPSLALLGQPLVQARGHLHRIEGVPAVATFHPRHLIKRPLDKALAWRDLLLLMEDQS